MSNIIEISQSKIGRGKIETVNARELHQFLGVKSRFNDWINNRIELYNFEENQDFTTLTKNIVSVGGTQKDYFISLDMAKELSMVERNEKGKQARQYFIECERRSKPSLNDPKTLKELLIASLDEKEVLVAQIEEERPKVEFFDQFVNADGLYGLQNAARALGCRPRKFIEWLKKEKYLFTQGGHLVPYAFLISKGWFEIKTEVINGRARVQSFVTPNGLEGISAKVPGEVMVECHA